MEVLCTATPAHLAGIRQTESATRGDVDAAGGAGYETKKYVGAGEYIRCASRGEDAVTARRDDIFESAIEVGHLIERAVKSNFHGRCEFHESASARRSHRVIRVQHTQDDAGRSEALRALQLGADGSEVGCGVDETVSVRAQQYVNRKTAMMDRLLDELLAGCETADIERGTKLDAVRASGPCRQASFKSFGA